MASIKLERKFWDVLGCSLFFFVCVDIGVFGDGTLFTTQGISVRDSKKLNIKFLHYL